MCSLTYVFKIFDSFERTQSRLTKVEQAQASFAKSLEQMLDMIRHLYTEDLSLKSKIFLYQSIPIQVKFGFCIFLFLNSEKLYRLDATLEKVILAASLMIGLQIIILLLLIRVQRKVVR